MAIASEFNETQLRFGILALAVPPSAARRWVQLGMMQRACGPLVAGLAGVDHLEAIGEIDSNQGKLAREVVSLFENLKSQRDDVFEERDAGPRSFMWSDALDDDDWKEIRRKARICYGALSVGKEPLISD